MLEALREFSRWSHIIVGFTGLAAFWLPIFSRKGGDLHRKAGKVFVACGYWVCASAALSCGLIATMIFSRGISDKNADSLGAITFLAYLAWVTFVSLPYATGVLRTKKDPTRLDTPWFRFLAYSCLVASGLVVVYATYFPSNWSLLLYILSPIGLGTGLPMLRYMKGRSTSQRQWFYEHMSATIGTGIAFHTAFAVFGASRLFDLPRTGWISVIPWILPALIGTPGLALWQRYYRRKFGELPGAAKKDGLNTPEASLTPAPVAD